MRISNVLPVVTDWNRTIRSEWAENLSNERGKLYLDGQHEGGIVFDVFLTHECFQLLVIILQVVNHDIHDLAVALPSSLVKHILALVVHPGHVRSILEQQLDRVVVAVGGSNTEWGAELLICWINLDILLSQEAFHNLEVASKWRVGDRLRHQNVLTSGLRDAMG